MSTFPLLLVTSPECFAGEQEMVSELFAAGLETLHLRKPSLDSLALERWLLALPRDLWGRIVVHRDVDTARAFGTGGLHGNPSYPPQSRNVSGVDGWDGSRSCSIHGLDELQQLSMHWHYCFLGPVFDSISKPGYRSGYASEDGRGLLRKALAVHHARSSGAPQVFALGGVDGDNLMLVRSMGFDGAALLGAVWNASDPVSAWKEIRIRAKECA